ncbi:MAG: hypothetical protein ACRC7R_01930 [Sarcina sp.]
MKDSRLIKETYLGIFTDEDKGIHEDIEEEFDDEVEDNIICSKQTAKPIIIKKFQNWESEYLD